MSRYPEEGLGIISKVKIFYVDEYPTSHFKIIKTEKLSADSLEVWGNLTIRDVTKMISFTASRRRDQKTGLVFYTTFKIDRFTWNISYQGSYWEWITSILDETFADADILLSVELYIASVDLCTG